MLYGLEESDKIVIFPENETEHYYIGVLSKCISNTVTFTAATDKPPRFDKIVIRIEDMINKLLDK